jgi:hypothetical protein
VQKLPEAQKKRLKAIKASMRDAQPLEESEEGWDYSGPLLMNDSILLEASLWSCMSADEEVDAEGGEMYAEGYDLMDLFTRLDRYCGFPKRPIILARYFQGVHTLIQL